MGGVRMMADTGDIARAVNPLRERLDQMERRIDALEQRQPQAPPTTDAMHHLRRLVEWFERSRITTTAEGTRLWVDAAAFVRGNAAAQKFTGAEFLDWCDTHLSDETRQRLAEHFLDDTGDSPTPEQSSEVASIGRDSQGLLVASVRGLMKKWSPCKTCRLDLRPLQEALDQLDADRWLTAPSQDVDEELRGMGIDPGELESRGAQIATEQMQSAPLTRDEAERIVREVTGDGEAWLETIVDGCSSFAARAHWDDARLLRSVVEIHRFSRANALQAVVDAVRAVCASERGRA